MKLRGGRSRTPPSTFVFRNSAEVHARPEVPHRRCAAQVTPRSTQKTRRDEASPAHPKPPAPPRLRMGTGTGTGKSTGTGRGIGTGTGTQVQASAQLKAQAPAQVQASAPAQVQVAPRVRAAHTAISYVCPRGASSAPTTASGAGKGRRTKRPFKFPEETRRQVAVPRVSDDRYGRPPGADGGRPRRSTPPRSPGWPRDGPGMAPGRAPARPRRTCRPHRAPRRAHPRSCSLMAAAARRRRGGRNSVSARPRRSAPLRPPRRQGGTAAAREGWREREREGGREEEAAPPRPAPAGRRCRPQPRCSPLVPAAGRLRAPRPSPASPGHCSYSGGIPRRFL